MNTILMQMVKYLRGAAPIVIRTSGHHSAPHCRSSPPPLTIRNLQGTGQQIPRLVLAFTWFFTQQGRNHFSLGVWTFLQKLAPNTLTLGALIVLFLLPYAFNLTTWYGLGTGPRASVLKTEIRKAGITTKQMAVTLRTLFRHTATEQ